MTTEEKRQYIGDHIHTFVTSKQPKKAKKITGMIIDLPFSELIPGIKSTHVLNRMINEANALLELEDIDTSNPSSPTSTTPQHDETNNKAQISTNPQHNDYQSAMFQEMYPSYQGNSFAPFTAIPSYQGNSHTQMTVTPSHQNNTRMSTLTQTNPHHTMNFSI